MRHYRPDLHDFFPRMRRGHGSMRRGQCVAESCSLRSAKGELHTDPEHNAAVWKEERGFHKDTPLEFCTSRCT